MCLRLNYKTCHILLRTFMRVCMCLCTHTCTLTVLTRNRVLNLPALGTTQAHGQHQQSCGEWTLGRKHAKLQCLVMIDIGPWFLSPGLSFSPPSLPTLNVPEAALSKQLIFSLWFFALLLPVTPVHVLMPWNRSQSHEICSEIHCSRGVSWDPWNESTGRENVPCREIM